MGVFPVPHGQHADVQAGKVRTRVGHAVALEEGAVVRRVPFAAGADEEQGLFVGGQQGRGDPVEGHQGGIEAGSPQAAGGVLRQGLGAAALAGIGHQHGAPAVAEGRHSDALPPPVAQIDSSAKAAVGQGGAPGGEESHGVGHAMEPKRGGGLLAGTVTEAHRRLATRPGKPGAQKPR